jgi:hypothetical protein
LPVTWLAPGNANAWAAAPGASFPTYSFSARRGAGFNLALPIQGVPVGLSLLGGDAAQGSVTIAEAKTYGVDTVSLYEDLTKWAAKRGSFLAHFAPGEDRQNYLRVISRVYLTGNLTVSLQSARSAGGGLSAGAPKPVDIVSVNPGDKPEAISKSIQSAAGGAAALPGGSLRVVAASANAITLREDFARPLIIGYLGFDVAIGANGALGPPIPTHAVLSNQQPVPAAAQQRVEQREEDIDDIVAQLTDPDTRQLSDEGLQVVFAGSAFEELATRFRGKSPEALRSELTKAKYRSSIAVFKANAAKLNPR